jgi:hypothetical protein
VAVKTASRDTVLAMKWKGKRGVLLLDAEMWHMYSEEKKDGPQIKV